MGAGEKQPGAPVLPPPPKKRVQLDRTLSLQVVVSSPPPPPQNPKYKTTSALKNSGSWISLEDLTTKPAVPTLADEEWGVEEEEEEAFGTPPPIEEPQCYSMSFSESSLADDRLLAITICKEAMKSFLAEHFRGTGGRAQLLEDVELGRVDPENLSRVLEGCKSSEMNALLLYACFIGRSELLPGFKDAKADFNYAEPEQGLTPLHLCAINDSLDGVKFLVDNGARVNARKIHTPFQFAAFGNSLKVAKFFLSQGVPQVYPTDDDDSVLHCAARSNALDVLRLLAPGNPGLNELDSAGFAPIHYVSDREHSDCLSELLRAGCFVDVASHRGNTALHLAAEAGCAKNIEILLDHGANPSLRNRRGQTALHLAARAHFLESVEVLLKRGGSDPNAEDNDGRSPLHVALGRSTLAFDVSEALVARNADVNKPDKYGYTPLHVAALNELSQSVDILIQHGADLSARTKGGTTALSVILRKTPTSLNVFKRRLDASIAQRQHGSATGEVELRLYFHPLLQHGQKGEIGLLATFIEEGYKEILEHPLCQSFLHLKWQRIRKYYVGRLLFYLLYVLVLTAWVMTALAHNCYNESKEIIDGVRLCDNSSALNELLLRHTIAMDIEWYALTFLTALEALRKLASLSTYASAKLFFSQVDNLVEWCVVLSVLATCLVYSGRTYSWQSHVGAYAVLCGWGNLMLMIGQLPMFGAYVAMFTSIQAQVFKLLLAYACLLVGFTASFCVMFPHSKSFSSPHTGLIKVLVMMTGEVDFEDLFFPADTFREDPSVARGASWFFLQVSAQLCFLLFLLFVTIVLMNLLVGIAVHDIKGLQKTAGLAKLVRQTKLICEVETALFLGLFPRRLMKMLRWTALVLHSSLRVVLTVRPLNPREKRLPSDVLAAAHRIARNRRSSVPECENFCPKQSVGTTYTCVKNDGRSTIQRSVPIEDDEENSGGYDPGRNQNRNGIDKFRDEILEIKNICDQNQKLIQDLVFALAMDGRYNSDIQREKNRDN